MATYKAVDVDQLETDLTAVAEAIRIKAGTTDPISFPDGFISTVKGIQLNTSGVPDGAGLYYIGKAESVTDFDFESNATGMLTE